jgi:hypothetical protein
MYFDSLQFALSDDTRNDTYEKPLLLPYSDTSSSKTAHIARHEYLRPKRRIPPKAWLSHANGVEHYHRPCAHTLPDEKQREHLKIRTKQRAVDFGSC